MTVFVIRVSQFETPSEWYLKNGDTAKAAAVRVYIEMNGRQVYEEIKDDITEHEQDVISERGVGTAKITRFRFKDLYVMDVIELTLLKINNQ